MCAVMFLRFFLLGSFTINSLIGRRYVLVVGTGSSLSPLDGRVVDRLVCGLPIRCGNAAVSSRGLGLVQMCSRRQVSAVQESLFTRCRGDVPELVVVVKKGA